MMHKQQRPLSHKAAEAALAPLRRALEERSEPDYAAFQRKLIPNIPPETILGVRTPILRQMAKELAAGDTLACLEATLPHRFFEENAIHGFLLEREKDFGRCIAGLNRFLPYVDNWATCDQIRPAALKKDLPRMREQTRIWMGDPHPYTVRYGLETRMRYDLEDAASAAEVLEEAAAIRREDYYVNMMIAWLFATALAKQYKVTLPFLTERRLPPAVHNAALQKARESFRIAPEQKAFLLTLKIPGVKSLIAHR